MHKTAVLSLVAALLAFPVLADAPAAPDPKDENTGGAGDLLVAPTRVVLEGNRRAAEVVLSNTGSKEATYRVELVHLHMDENGKYIELKDSELEKYGDKWADKMLRYSPHQVTLKPKETQTVKLMVRKVEGMPDGEYRSHLAFHANPQKAVGEDIEAPPVEEGKIAIRLLPVYGVSIPVIVRQGELSAKAGISALKQEGKKATVTLTRSGSRSVFGDVLLLSAGKVVGQLRGVAVLPPATKRNVTIELAGNAVGPLTAEYRARADEGGGTLATYSP